MLGEDRVDERALLGGELEELLLDRALGDELVDRDHAGLADAVRTVGGLVGSEVATSVKRSIDIIQDHRQLEQTQHRYERILWYFGYTHRWAPGSTTASASFGPFARPEISRSYVLDLFTTAPAA